MPRRKEPTREVSISINDENVRDALVLWVQKYHGIDLDIKQIEVSVSPEGRITAIASRRPSVLKEVEHDATPVKPPEE